MKKLITFTVLASFVLLFSGCKNDHKKSELSIADNPQALIKDKNITLKKVKD